MKNFISVPEKILRRLYIEKELSSVDVAQKLHCSPSSIRNKLRRYGIPLRSHYEAHLLCNLPKYKRRDFSKNPVEKAYIIGFRLGDLYVYQARLRTIIASMSSTKTAQIKLFKNLFSRYGHIWQGKRVWKSRSGTYYRETVVQCYLNNTFAFLVSKEDLIEPWILKNTGCFSAFLAGYSDAEGSFCIYNKTDGNFSLRSQDKNILHQIRTKLVKLGILCRPPQVVRKRGTKDVRGTISNEDIWGLWVYRKDALLKLITLLGHYSKHADKRAAMKIVKDNVLERNKKYGNLLDRRFYKLYLTEGVKV